MRPESGGRIVLRHQHERAESVRYAAELAWAGDPEPGHAHVDYEVEANGNVRALEPGRAPLWLEELGVVLLRSAYRAHVQGTAWPRRITRWREAR